MAELHFHFQNRAAGSFGTGRMAAVAEWCTHSWKRFTIIVMSFLIVAPALLSHLHLAQKAALVIAAPALAIISWYFLLLIILVASTFGRFERLLSLLVVIYFFMFSRLVAQPAPLINLNLNGRP